MFFNMLIISKLLTFIKGYLYKKDKIRYVKSFTIKNKITDTIIL